MPTVETRSQGLGIFLMFFMETQQTNGYSTSPGPSLLERKASHQVGRTGFPASPCARRVLPRVLAAHTNFKELSDTVTVPLGAQLLCLPGSLILPNVCRVWCFLVLKHVSQKSKSSQFLHLNLGPLMGNIWQPSHLFQTDGVTQHTSSQRKPLLPTGPATQEDTHVTPGCTLGTSSISDRSPVQ